MSSSFLPVLTYLSILGGAASWRPLEIYVLMPFEDVGIWSSSSSSSCSSSLSPPNSWKCILGWKIKAHLEGKHNRIDARRALKTTDVLMLFNVLVH